MNSDIENIEFKQELSETDREIGIEAEDDDEIIQPFKPSKITD